MIRFPKTKKSLTAFVLSLAMILQGGQFTAFAAPDDGYDDPYGGQEIHEYHDLFDDGLKAPDTDEYLTKAEGGLPVMDEDPLREESLLKGADDPYYSSVDKGYVSDVIDQADSQLCWAFSAASCMETDAVKKGLMSDDEHLSADALGYYFFNRVPDKKGLTQDTVIRNTAPGTSSYYDNGGNTINAVFELMQWLNPIHYDKAPFTAKANEYPDTVEFAYDQDLLHLSGARWTASSSQKTIKQMVSAYGAAAIGIYMKDSAVRMVSYNGVKVHTLYNDSRESINHAVTIVGWDDEFPAELFKGSTSSSASPEEDGAFICKNSYNDHPYFYLSYRDASILSSSYNNKAISFCVDSSSNYDNNYGYDGGIGTSRASAVGTIYGAEIFCASADPGDRNGAEEIKAVSFATNTAGASYTVSVYTGLSSNSQDPTSGILMSQVSSEQPLACPGYYTVELPEPVYVDEGVYFSVVVSLSAHSASDHATLMYDDSYGGSTSSWVYSNPVAKSGRSYLSKDGVQWSDTAADDLKAFYDPESGHTPTSGYVRIKAYTDKTAATGQYLIDNDMVALIPDQVYTGLQLTPDPQIYYGTQRLKKDRDYTVTYGANKAVGKGTGTMTINGIGRFMTRSPIMRSFNIKKASITDPAVIVSGTDQPLSFTGRTLTPISLSFNGIELKANRDYTIKYSKNIKPGAAFAVIKGKGNFDGKRKEEFRINVLDINDEGITVKDIKPQEYSGDLLEPNIVLLNQYDHKAVLVKDVDYTVEYFDNLMPGEAYAMVTGKGSYTGIRRVDFTIEGADLALANVTKVGDYTYCGEAISPEVEVYYGSKKLVESVDYEITYSNNIDVGVAHINITGRKGTIFAGTGLSRTFNIRSANLSNAVLENFGDVAYKAGVRYYTQNESPTDPNRMKIRLAGGYYLKPGEYTVTYKDNYSTGATRTASMTITAKSDNISGTITRTFDIIAGAKVVLNDFTNPKITVTGMNSSRQYIYDASNHRTNADNSVKPAVTVSYKGVVLTKGVDYEVKYHDNNAIGTAYLTIEAVNGSGYTGVRTEYFDIIGKPIYVTALGVADNDFMVSEPADCVYTGAPQKPEIIIRENVLVDKDEKHKSGESVKRLVEDRDYTLKYHKNVDAGQAYAVMEGIGEYSGSHTFYFNIESADLSEAAHGVISPKTYTAARICPELRPTNAGGYLRKGVDYNVSYGENINAGTGTVVFTAAEMTQEELDAGLVPNYVGQLTVTFTIKPRPLNSSAITVSGLNAVRFEGTQVTPLISVYLTSNDGSFIVPESEYDVIYGKNAKSGRGTVTIKARPYSAGGTGNYIGSRVNGFVIEGADFRLTEKELSGYTVSYTGKPAKLSIPAFDSPSVNLAEKVDYRIRTDKRRDVGRGIFTIVGRGTYKGTFEYGNYEIVPLQIDEGQIELIKVTDGVFTSPNTPVKCPKLMVRAGKKKLVKGRDYVVNYFNNTGKGTATVVVTLVNNYSGSGSATFNIV